MFHRRSVSFLTLCNWKVSTKYCATCCVYLSGRTEKDPVSARLSSCLSSTFPPSVQGYNRTLHNRLMQCLLFSGFVCGCLSATDHYSPTTPQKKTTVLTSLESIGIKVEVRPTWHCYLGARESHSLLQT